MCGEHASYTAGWVWSFGSSPRVRGTSSISNQSHRLGRFIPACAGNMPSRTTDLATNSVHPRVCGEHYVLPKVTNIITGSSPRVRGTFYLGIRKLSKLRFIPACAGNMIYRALFCDSISVHPRVCGEHIRISSHLVTLSGSSPRVRGTCLCTPVMGVI